jgi:hypothetical protein
MSVGGSHDGAEMRAAWKLMKPHWVYYILVVASIALVVSMWKGRGYGAGIVWIQFLLIVHIMIWVGFYEKAKGR